jgi:hypothetical protein
LNGDCFEHIQLESRRPGQTLPQKRDQAHLDQVIDEHHPGYIRRPIPFSLRQARCYGILEGSETNTGGPTGKLTGKGRLAEHKYLTDIIFSLTYRTRYTELAAFDEVSPIRGSRRQSQSDGIAIRKREAAPLQSGGLQQYIERVRAADLRKHKGKKAGYSSFTSDEVDEAEELGLETSSQAGSPDQTESATARGELTEGSSTLTDRDDSGGKKTTNHVEPDFGLLWEDMSTPHYYGCPRCAVTFEAKRWCGSPDKDSSNNVSSDVNSRSGRSSHSMILVTS